MTNIPATRPELTTEEINALPPMEFDGQIVLITEVAQAREAVVHLSQQTVIGFDTETRPSFQKGEFYHVSLLQLATADTAYLFRLGRGNILPIVAPILSNPDILKVGVATRDDVKGLMLMHEFDPAGFLDIARQLAVGNKTPGLRALTAEFLGARLTKAAKTTNWDRANLSEEQLAYAAKDAVAGLRIYNKLNPSHK